MSYINRNRIVSFETVRYVTETCISRASVLATRGARVFSIWSVGIRCVRHRRVEKNVAERA